MSLPAFITFTGADDKTSVDGMLDLEFDYPGMVEFGILFSPKRIGTPRYPSRGWVDELVRRASLRATLSLSAHLCGGHSKQLINVCGVGVDLTGFKRCQINTADEEALHKTQQLKRWAARKGVAPILQCRGSFPEDDNVLWLYDPSGGKGVEPPTKPSHERRDVLVGYAGGIGPDNVSRILSEIDADDDTFWIDMETRIRNDEDEFDLDLCRAVLQEVYG